MPSPHTQSHWEFEVIIQSTHQTPSCCGAVYQLFPAPVICMNSTLIFCNSYSKVPFPRMPGLMTPFKSVLSPSHPLSCSQSLLPGPPLSFFCTALTPSNRPVNLLIYYSSWLLPGGSSRKAAPQGHGPLSGLDTTASTLISMPLTQGQCLTASERMDEVVGPDFHPRNCGSRIHIPNV